jgi:Flp pilus assembly protein TadG
MINLYRRTKAIFKNLEKIFSSQNGNVAILSVTVAMILVLFTPFIIDVAILLKTRADAKSAADAASLAAAQEILFLENGEDVARGVAEMNNTKFISYSVENNETVVTVSKTANLIFIDNLIKNSIEIKATSSSGIRFPWKEG